MDTLKSGSFGYASAKISVAFMGFAIAFYAAALALADRAGQAPERLTRDPAAIFDFWPFVGSLSQIGILLMAATCSICLFAAVSAKENRGLLTAIGFFSGYFLIDDAFMLHEAFFPSLGIREKVSLVPMALSGLLIFWYNKKHFLSWDAIAIWISGICLSVSIVMDGIFKFSSFETWIEDGFKFVGLAMWALHWVFVAHYSIRKNLLRA